MKATLPKMPDFRPFAFLKGPHLQTLAGWAAIPETPLPETEIIRMRLEDGDQTTLHLHPSRDLERSCPILLLLHGLEGDASKPYMVRTARKAWQKGFRTVRMNLRCCGDAEGLSRRFYNGAQSEDVAAVCRWLTGQFPDAPLFVLGFSLGGNLVLKAALQEDLPRLDGVIGICPPVDPHRSASALRSWRNLLYHYRFVQSLVDRVERNRHLLSPHPEMELHPRMSLMEFDALFTAPHSGYRDLKHYYDTCQTSHLLNQIRCPWQIITSRDDPMVPFDSFDPVAGQANLIATRHGGHLGFIGPKNGQDPDWRWAENRAIDFCCRVLDGSG